MIRLSLLAAAATAIALPALAQQNEVYIEQRGTGNQLTIDQSSAVNSEVRGLGINRDNALLLSPVGPTILENPDPAPLAVADRATQSGGDNRANITITGDGGLVLLTQENQPLPNGGFLPNVANIQVTGPAQAAIGQFGNGNRAGLIANGDAQGLIIQTGDFNRGRLNVGNGMEGTLIQNGMNNNAGTVDVQGIATSVTYIQNGNNLAPVNGQGVSVISNAAAVTITQTTFGTGN